MSARILVVDDEEIVVRSCLRILESGDYRLDIATDGAQALRKIEEDGVDLVILDIMMPHVDGAEVLRRVKEAHPEIEVVMVTGLSQIDSAVKCMKLGAFDYLPKPFDPGQLKSVVERALERQRLLRETGERADGSQYRMESIIGTSPAMQRVYRLVARAAPTNTTVLVTGESGTGKELVARAIHHNSLRRDRPFVAIDCNSLSENLLESELFGHVKGAFTGAVANKKGMFEIAAGGTLFLDEIGNIPVSTQAKLLRVIQEREYRAVGDTRTQAADVRLLAATNKDLKAMIAGGTFRDDLYYRINIFPIEMPPLRERREDIPALAMHFLRRYADELGRGVSEFSEGAMSALVGYAWPGNVRELENTVQRGAIMTTDHIVRRVHLANIVDASVASDQEVPRTGDELKRIKKAAREKSVEEIEKSFVLEALKRNDWNVTRSAEDTGMQRANFQALMKKHNVRVRDIEGHPGGSADD
ncbi:MAG TPA: sigma-54 dependent transcriptional regulator [Burkholderiales bacterium]